MQADLPIDPNRLGWVTGIVTLSYGLFEIDGHTCRQIGTAVEDRIWRLFGAEARQPASLRDPMRFDDLRGGKRDEAFSADAPFQGGHHTWPPYWRSKFAISLSSAKCKGVLPKPFLRLASAPLASSNSATSLWPSYAAMCNGVCPSLLLALT